MSEHEPLANAPGDPLWARLLFGDEPWVMLSVLLACGLITLILSREAVPAILAVVLAGLAANAGCSRLAKSTDENETRT